MNIVFKRSMRGKIEILLALAALLVIIRLVNFISQPRNQAYDEWALYVVCGDAALQENRYTKAESCYKEALCRTEGQSNINSNRARTLEKLSRLYIFIGEYSKAEDCENEALDIRRRLDGSNPSTMDGNYLRLAQIHMFTGRLNTAEQYLIEVESILELSYSLSDPKFVPYLGSLGVLLEKEGKYKEARAQYAKCLSIQEKTESIPRADIADTLRAMARVDLAEKKYASGELLLKRALDIAEKSRDEETLSRILNACGVFYSTMGKYDEAISYFNRTLKVIDAMPEANPHGRNQIMANYRTVLAKANRGKRR